MGFLQRTLKKFQDARNNDEKDREVNEVVDPDAIHLSYVGKAAYEVLRTEHGELHNILWNATAGEVVEKVHQSPHHVPIDADVERIDPREHHSDWLPEKMGEILSRTEKWADVMSLGPPDGLFMEEVQRAIQTVAVRAHQRNKTVTIRMMFGSIIGMPVNCNALIEKLTASVPVECEDNLQMWVGAWRKGVSWNHAKIIAVDGIYLHTGGHNMWDYHYLKESPIHDLSIELKGPVAHDGHLFANDQWEFVERVQTTTFGELINKYLPDNTRLIVRTRVAVSEFPKGKAPEFPPAYQRNITTGDRSEHTARRGELPEGTIPILTMGRYGALIKKDRPADDAFVAMFHAAKKSIRMALQDLGPVCIPHTNKPLPGCVWPDEYLNAFATAIWERGVDIEIVLSNPGSIPGGLTPVEANYGNGWTCVDVAAEIIKRIKKQYPDAADDDSLKQKVRDNLRVCFIRRSTKHENKWATGQNIGLHSKHFIIDERTLYIGSQNLYVCDLAEWGVVIDDVETVKRIIREYWKPLWHASFTSKDVDPDDVIDQLDVDRDGEKIDDESELFKAQNKATLQQTGLGRDDDDDDDDRQHNRKKVRRYHPDNADLYGDTDED